MSNQEQPLHYKGWRIEPKPKQNEDGDWLPCAELAILIEGCLHVKPPLFAPPQKIFKTEKEARDYSTRMAMKWVDDNG